MWRRCFGVMAFALAASGASAAEIRIIPADFIVLNPTNPDKHYADLVVHTVAVATGATETAALKSLRIEILSHGRVVLTRNVSPDELMGGTQFLAGAPLPDFVNGQVLNANGLDGIFGRHVSFASSPHMAPSQALLAMRLHFSVGFTPEEVRATATLGGASGENTVTANVPVKSYMSPISYRAPLDGQWMMQAIPGIQSHHRLNPSTEFAMDFFKLGSDGHVRRAESRDAASFYGFGAPVRAAADGTVVRVIADQVQDRAALIRKPGEAADTFYKRVDEFHLQKMKRNFAAANAGNLVTIRHEKNGVTEYSSYGHLKSGSVRVKPGDRVAQGEIVGEVGDTGDSAAVHLHFQINAGPDAFTSMSLPVTFANMRSVDGNDEMGRLVTTEGDEERF